MGDIHIKDLKEAVDRFCKANNEFTPGQMDRTASEHIAREEWVQSKIALENLISPRVSISYGK